MNDRDEYQLYTKPRHTLPQYITAHQMAGDLELVDANTKPAANNAPSYTEFNARASAE